MGNLYPVRIPSMLPLVLLAIFAAPLASPLPTTSDRDYTERSEYTQPLGAHGRLLVRSEIGDVRIHTSDRHDVRVVAVKKFRTQDDSQGRQKVAQLQVSVTHSDGEVRVIGQWPQRTLGRLVRGESLQLDLDIELPRDARIEVRHNIGEVVIDGAGSDVEVTQNIGEVRVEGTFRPRVVRLETGIGEVTTNLTGKRSGWLGKKFTSILDGEHTVNVKVHIGEIRVLSNGRKTISL